MASRRPGSDDFPSSWASRGQRAGPSRSHVAQTFHAPRAANINYLESQSRSESNLDSMPPNTSIFDERNLSSQAPPAKALRTPANPDSRASRSPREASQTGPLLAFPPEPTCRQLTYPAKIKTGQGGNPTVPGEIMLVSCLQGGGLQLHASGAGVLVGSYWAMAGGCFLAFGPEDGPFAQVIRPP